LEVSVLAELIYACEIFALLLGGVLLLLRIGMFIRWVFSPPLTKKSCEFTQAFEQEVWKKCLYNEEAEKAWKNGDRKKALALLGYPRCNTI
jgi:hypothetical protein